MVNATGNEVAPLTQPDQDPAIGNEGNEAGASAEAATLPPRHTGPPPNAPDQEAPAYVATYYTGQLPAAQGNVASALNARATPGELRTQALLTLNLNDTIQRLVSYYMTIIIYLVST